MFVTSQVTLICSHGWGPLNRIAHLYLWWHLMLSALHCNYNYLCAWLYLLHWTISSLRAETEVHLFIYATRSHQAPTVCKTLGWALGVCLQPLLSEGDSPCQWEVHNLGETDNQINDYNVGNGSLSQRCKRGQPGTCGRQRDCPEKVRENFPGRQHWCWPNGLVPKDECNALTREIGQGEEMPKKRNSLFITTEAYVQNDEYTNCYPNLIYNRKILQTTWMSIRRELLNKLWSTLTKEYQANIKILMRLFMD